MQHIQDREGATAGAHLVHRRLVELAPLDRELGRVDAGDAPLPEERTGFTGHARAPVDYRAEDVEEAGFDCHGAHYARTKKKGRDRSLPFAALLSRVTSSLR